jgi:hypothetical protein
MFDCSGFVGGAEALVHVIDSGVRARAERYQRMLNGEIQPDDLRPRDL